MSRVLSFRPIYLLNHRKHEPRRRASRPSRASDQQINESVRLQINISIGQPQWAKYSATSSQLLLCSCRSRDIATRDVVYANPQSISTNTDEPLMTSLMNEELYSAELQDFVQNQDPLASLEASVSYAETEALRTTIKADSTRRHS
jgi:hypothetical protein